MVRMGQFIDSTELIRYEQWELIRLKYPGIVNDSAHYLFLIKLQN